MGLSSYKNPPNITMMGVVAENPTLQTVPRGTVFNPQGASSQVVPFQRPTTQVGPLQSTIPTGPSEIVPFQRPGTRPSPVQLPQQPVRAPNIPPVRPNPIQQAARGASQLINQNPLVQAGKGLAQGQSIGKVAGQVARQSPAAKLIEKITQAKNSISRTAGTASKVGRAVGPAAGGVVSGLANPLGIISLIGTLPAAYQAGQELADIVAPEQAAAEQALADSIIKLEQAKADAKQRELLLRDIEQLLNERDAQGIPSPLDDLEVFTPTAPWSPIPEPPIEPPPVELPPIDPNQDIGLDLGPIERPSPIAPPEVPIDPVRNPDLTTGKGGVNLNTPIWEKLSNLEAKLDNFQIPEPDWASILEPIINKLDLIIVAIPPIMEGLQTAIEAPPNIEIPPIDWTPVLNAITSIGPPTISAIGTLLVPLLNGITAVSAQIANQKMAVAVGLPQGINLAVGLPQTYQMATMIPQSLQQAIAIPQATQIAVGLPQALSTATLIPQLTEISLNDTANSQKLDVLNQLNTDQINQLQIQLEALNDQTNRLRNLRLQVKECCDILDKKLREGLDNDKNIKDKLKAEFDKNEERFPIINREGATKCKEDEDANNYSFGGYSLPGLQGHLDYMLELQKLLVYKLCNFEIGGEINGELDLTCEGDENPTILPFSGKGIEGLALQSAVVLEGLKRIWSKVCRDTEINGEIPLLCPSEDTSFPEFMPYQGKGIQGLSAQLSALALLNQKVLQESCKKNEPIVVKAHYETHLEEFKVTKSLELVFGGEYPTQKGSLWHLTIPYPKGEFIGDGEFCEYSLWTWEDDFEGLERLHGQAYCRLDLANSNRFIAVYARSAEIGRDWLRMLYAKFVNQDIAPPSKLDDDGLPFVRISPNKKPRHNPIERTTRCVKAVVTDFDANNDPIKYAVWVPPRS